MADRTTHGRAQSRLRTTLTLSAATVTLAVSTTTPAVYAGPSAYSVPTVYAAPRAGGPVGPSDNGPAAPTLVSPADGTTFTHSSRATTLSWDASADATSYHIEVQCLGCATAEAWSTLLASTTTTTSYGFTWPSDSTGRWRVVSVAASGAAGSPSPWYSFTYRTTGGVLPAPLQLSPDDGTTVGDPHATTLTWGPVEGASQYVVDVDLCGTASCATGTALAHRTASAPTVVVDAGTATPAARWRVSAVGAGGTSGDSSPWWTFTYSG